DPSGWVPPGVAPSPLRLSAFMPDRRTAATALPRDQYRRPSRYSSSSYSVVAALDRRATVNSTGSESKALRAIGIGRATLTHPALRAGSPLSRIAGEVPSAARRVREHGQYICWPPLTEGVEPVMKSAAAA